MEDELRDRTSRKMTIKILWISRTSLTLVPALVILRGSQALSNQRGRPPKGEPQRPFLSLISKEKKAVTPALSTIKTEMHTCG
jgi:hypothetical protein